MPRFNLEEDQNKIQTQHGSMPGPTSCKCNPDPWASAIGGPSEHERMARTITGYLSWSMADHLGHNALMRSMRKIFGVYHSLRASRCAIHVIGRLCTLPHKIRGFGASSTSIWADPVAIAARWILIGSSETFRGQMRVGNGL